MKRDDEYIRNMLFEMEANEDSYVFLPSKINLSHEDKKRKYHMELLLDYGYLRMISGRTVRLTAQGHDYLNAVRDEGIWQRTKASVAETGGSVALDVLKQIALGLFKKQIEERTGIVL